MHPQDIGLTGRPSHSVGAQIWQELTTPPQTQMGFTATAVGPSSTADNQVVAERPARHRRHRWIARSAYKKRLCAAVITSAQEGTMF